MPWPPAAVTLGDMPPVLAVHELTKRFGAVTAVNELSFELKPGSITGFLGPNGAGKTTTLRVALGLAAATHGHALVFGQPYADLSRPSRRVGAVLEAADLHPGRSGRDHLRVLAAAVGMPRRRVDEVLALVDLARDAGRNTGGYSLGMRQRLALAAALLGDPELLILDEPANGLDPEGVRWLRDFLREFAGQGKTVLVSSHHLAEVAQTVAQVVIINHGCLVTESPLSALTAHLGGSVRVRSARLEVLAQALRRAGVTGIEPEDGVLHVHGMSAERIGEIALAAQVPVAELSTESSSLEDVFLELTAGQRA